MTSEDKYSRIDTHVLQDIPRNVKSNRLNNKLTIMEIKNNFNTDLNQISLTINASNSSKHNDLKKCCSQNGKIFRIEMPIRRTKEQEYAYRQIEDVHNYSKLKRSNIDHFQIPIRSRYSRRNCSQPGGDSIENHIKPERKSEKNTAYFPIITHEMHASLQQKADLLACDEIDIKAPPDHHIRRPMNAFLIFCKRHRGIVKEKFKNFENRAITKILGEWWAFLDATEKTCYMNLAQQNKDAFFNSHPNFKWYKLPAPYKRSLNSRPGNNDFSEFSMNNNGSGHESAPSYLRSTNLDWNDVSYFKFADEKHMGELNKLMHSKDLEESKLNEGSPCCRTNINSKLSTITKIYINSNCTDNPNSCSSNGVYSTPTKPVHSSNGNKHKELIKTSQITSISSKKLNFSSPPDTNLYMVKDLHDHKVTTSTIPRKDTKLSSMSHRQDSDNLNKLIGYCSFDLEEKIGRLPVQSFETYLHRKKNTKSKKKVSCRKRASALHKVQEFFSYKSQTVLSQPKTIEKNKRAIGSQKRKARKESIIRRNTTSVHNDIQMLLTTSFYTSTSETKKGNPRNRCPSAVYSNTTSNLFLAETEVNQTEYA